MIPKLPAQAENIILAMEAAGGRGYLVGGALRDLMLGKQPKDWDFATSLSPQRLMAIFPGARSIGGDYGTVQVPFGGGSCEITPCRAEEGYSDKRHPDKVVFIPDIFADLSRRDFTVNAMAFDGKVLFDPYGGQEDLAKKLLRCVGEPKIRFEEDALRVLRLFRLAAQLGFTAEWETYQAAGAAMDTIAFLPRERVYGEVRRILLSAGPKVLGGLIAKGGLAAYGFHFAPNLEPLNEVPAKLLYRMWALIALCGADPAVVAAQFGFSRRFVQQLDECTKLYRMGPANNNTELKQKIRYSRLDYAALAATFAAVSPAFVAEPALFASVCINGEPYRLEDLAVDGDMLRYQGIRGEACGRVLHELLSAVIKNPGLNQTRILLGLARSLKQLF